MFHRPSSSFKFSIYDETVKLVPDVFKGLNSSASSSPGDQRSTTELSHKADIYNPKTSQFGQLGFCDLCTHLTPNPLPVTSIPQYPRGVTFDTKPDGCCSVLVWICYGIFFRTLFERKGRKRELDAGNSNK